MGRYNVLMRRLTTLAVTHGESSSDLGCFAELSQQSVTTVVGAQAGTAAFAFSKVPSGYDRAGRILLLTFPSLAERKARDARRFRDLAVRREGVAFRARRALQFGWFSRPPKTCR